MSCWTSSRPVRRSATITRAVRRGKRRILRSKKRGSRQRAVLKAVRDFHAEWI